MIKQSIVWSEMARRKVQLHKKENWDEIKLWGLFRKSEIKHLLEKGLLIPAGNYQSRCLGWYYPSKEAWEKYIKPIIDAYSLEELTKMAGWDIR